MEISKFDKVIDSRDVIERLEKLQEEKEDLQNAIDEAKDVVQDAYDARQEKDTLETEQAHHAAMQAEMEARKELADWEIENQEELDALESLNDDGESGASDWAYGATLIHEDYFEEYCQELVSDIGDLPREIPSYIEIDWEATANNLKVDYTEIDFDGETFLVR